MSSTAAERYRARLRKVLDYVDAHLHEDLGVERLSSVAAFSKYHFHRQFTAFFGVGVYRYVQLSRLKRASFQLAFRDDLQIIDIALVSGYSAPEAFARAFRKSIGQSPTEFRKQPQWNPWHATYQPLSALRMNHMKTVDRTGQVRVVNFRQTRVATLEHRGDPNLLGESIRKFIDWRKQNNLPPRISATFNIVYDNPAETDPENFRFDLCASTEREVAPNPFGVVAKTIPGGRCAVLRHIGSDDTLPDSVNYLYSEWLPQSGEELRDFPPYFQRVIFFPDVPEHEAITDIFIPLQ
ncbi:MAG TPA: AraC family transcriptional regulator [Steroidobacteraceae bacterium]|nr:AraC family transcriptional regulator [Steroidobacteraceae bacterium]